MRLIKRIAPPQIPGYPGEEKPAIRAAVVSDVGCKRPNNEDNFLLGQTINETCADRAALSMEVPGTLTGWLLCGVFDGMGGGKKGEVAARLAAEAFREAAGRLRDIREPEMADRMIRAAFQQANNRVLPLRTECGAYGTTGTVVCTNGSVFKIYSLGDSRGYLLRNRDLFQLTRDHTLAQMKIEAGTYKQGDPQVKKDRNRLTEYIGRDSTGEGLGPEETQWLPLTAGDSILLCSDGLYDMCGNGEIGTVMNRCADARGRTAALTQLALERGGTDNVTCMCLEFQKL